MPVARSLLLVHLTVGFLPYAVAVVPDGNWTGTDSDWHAEVPPDPPEQWVDLPSVVEEPLPPPRPDARIQFPDRRYRLRGEFERQHALLIGGSEMLASLPNLFVDLVAATRGRTQLLVLANDAEEVAHARQLIGDLPCDHVHFVEVLHNTMWARDYGPELVEWQGGPAIVDSSYGESGRADDDGVPLAVAQQLDVPLVISPLILEGGNLLSNGRGICVATSKVLRVNHPELTEPMVREWMKRLYGAHHVEFLEPLEGESTGHADMFTTFASPDVVLVAACNRQLDPVNADLLDRNAARLGRLNVNGAPLRVVRVPMPDHADGVWRTYTNVVYANGVVLLPTYANFDSINERVAKEAYRRALPGWEVVPIDASGLIELGGALHCVTLNLGPLQRLPEFLPPRPRLVPTTDSDPLRILSQVR